MRQIKIISEKNDCYRQEKYGKNIQKNIYKISVLAIELTTNELSIKKINKINFSFFLQHVFGHIKNITQMITISKKLQKLCLDIILQIFNSP